MFDIKIAAYTVGGVSVASSRLRSFYLFHNSVVSSGVAVRRPGNCFPSFDSNVIHLQKTLNFRHLFIGFIYRILGYTIVFDFDDQHFSKRDMLYMILLMNIASIVTTDTLARKNYWLPWILSEQKVYVVPDIVDVDPISEISTDINDIDVLKNQIVWIGSSSNYGSIEILLRGLESVVDLKSIVISDLGWVEKHQSTNPHICFVEWRKDILLDSNYKGCFLLLNHDTDLNAARLKSDNKMVLGLIAKMIPLVSNTFAYEALAKEIGSLELICVSHFEYIDKVRQFKKKEFFKKRPDIIEGLIKKYSAKYVYKTFECILLKHVKQKKYGS